VAADSHTAGRDTSATEVVPAFALFLLIGAEPRTEWLKKNTVAPDDRGYVLTGSDVLIGSGLPLRRPPAFLETGLPGVFARRRTAPLDQAGSAAAGGGIDRRSVHTQLPQQRRRYKHVVRRPRRSSAAMSERTQPPCLVEVEAALLTGKTSYVRPTKSTIDHFRLGGCAEVPR
jgi:hypothetical protein